LKIFKGFTFIKYPRLGSIASAIILALVMVWAWAAPTPQPQSLWVATQLALHQIDPVTHQLTQSIALGDEPEAIAVAPDTGMVWVLAGNSLLKYDSTGVLILNIDLTSTTPGLLNSDHLVLNPYDGTVWVAASKVLMHFDTTGVSLGSWSLDQKIEELILSPDETLWLASSTELFQLDDTGVIKAQIALPADLTDVESITIDPLNNKIWVGGGTVLWQWQSDALSVTPVPVMLPVGTLEVEAVEYDYLNGLLWVATDSRIIAYDNLGVVRAERIFTDQGWGQAESLMVAPAETGIWLGTDKEVIHLSTNGQVLAVIPVTSEVEDIASTETVITPVVDITSPANGLLTNNAYLLFEFGLSSTCNAEPCILGEPYWQGLVFDFNLNGVAIGQATTRADDIATYTPASRLPEGQNVVTAQVTDAFGHLSDPKTHQFVVDTTPPVFLSVLPVNDTIVNTNTVGINGSVDDLFASVMLQNSVGDVLGLQGSIFNFSAGLNEGANSFMLIARDSASNQSYYNLSVVRDTQAPVIPVLNLITFKILANGDVLVNGAAGSAEPGSTIVITNPRTGETFIVVVNADGSFSVIVKAQPGDQLKIVARDAAGNASDPVSVTMGTGLPDPADIAPSIDPTVGTTLGIATEFLYTGTNPIQEGVAPSTIDPERVAVLRGKVQTRNGQSLSGVTITIHDHPEYGSTQTRNDGMFDMAVNGGGWLTIDYIKDGFLPVQRQINVPWQDYAWLPDIVMIPVDDQVTAINLASTVPIQVARGNAVTDDDGTRQATVFFPQGTQATMMLPDGTAQTLTTLNVRATEYTVGPNGPSAMPGKLPPTSGYTYAIELSVDEALAAGAKKVQFNQPVPFYLENFLNFPVGGIVPTGYYDRDKVAWIPSANGRVIQILSITNGLVDLDLDGSGIPADSVALAALGITDAERQQLATLYQPSQSLWRVAITHFTPWDYNWPYGPPGDAEAPPPEDLDEDEEDDPDCMDGSVIECQNQILGETIPVTGTPFTLNYRSDRVPGRQATLNITLSGTTVPTSLQRIELEVTVAGRRFTQSFPATPSQRHIFNWDGKDAYGRTLQGSQTATVKIGYVYRPVYLSPATNFVASFARFSDSGVSISGQGRSEVTIWRSFQRGIGAWDARGQGLGGWTVDVLHGYDPSGQVLYRGDGRRRSSKAFGSIITTVAGNGLGGFSGDGGPATAASLNYPTGVALGPDGSLYIADIFNNRIRRVGPDGIITTVAGNGLGGFSGDGGPATLAEISNPTDVTLGPDGSLYIADYWNHRIRRVGPDGIISTVAGSGTGYIGAFSGDGGPATAARLNAPTSVTAGPDGSLYIVDSYNLRIRRVGPDGIINTVAGDGYRGSPSDGVPATAASLDEPRGVALGSDGSLYIAGIGNSTIHRVGPDGIITFVAGSGGVGLFSGDGGPATEAELYGPMSVAVRPDGSLYIADTYHARIRRVGPDGIITTVAGNGQWLSSGDGGPATAAGLYAGDVTIGPDGSLYFAGRDNGRIRRVGPSLPGFDTNEIVIPSEDGRRLYQFDPNGRHLRTLNTNTGTTFYEFGYDANGYLIQIQDGDSNITIVERDADGNPVAIIAPDGQRTTLILDANGYLASATNPANETTAMGYTADGLLTTFTDARSNTATMTYDALGRLLKDENAAGGFWTLTRTEGQDQYTVSMSSAEGRTTDHQVERLSNRNKRRTNTYPDGTQTERLIKQNGTTTNIATDGTRIVLTEGPDPRFGMLSPVPESLTVTTPNGLAATVTTTRDVTLSAPDDPLSLTTLTETVSLNGRTSTRAYDAATKTYTNNTPENRQSTQVINAQGRIIQSQVPGIEAVNIDYDIRGRLTAITQGTGIETRTTTLTYNPEGYLQTITDPLTRSLSFTFDPAGRVTQQTLPDGRVIGYTYDENGNVTSITPPGKPVHNFQYDAVDLENTYSPPVVTTADPATRYAYNLDKQLTTITRPDGQTVRLNYGTAGKLGTLTLPRGTVTYGYEATTGQLNQITAPDGGILYYTYDGYLSLSESWSGQIAGSVARSYDNNFRVKGINVNGMNIVYGYDLDSQITQAGALSLTRDAQNGFLTGTTLANTTTTQTYNAFGEIISNTSTEGANTVAAFQYTYDKLGRITTKSETVDALPSNFTYEYDTAGRLTNVLLNGSQISNYVYDANGNRTSYINNLGTTLATYDDQDRLLTYGNKSYTYTENGELLTTTENGITTTYNYDVLGNLMQLTLPGSVTIDYLTDGQNRRIGKKVNGLLTQGFLYQDQLNPVAELDSAGNVVTRFIYGTKSNVPDYMVKGGITYRIISDHLGSPRLVINTTDGNITQKMDYDEFGNITTDTDPGFQPFGFAGGIYDQHTKLTRFGARDYDAETGRWTSKDPIGFDVLNDPVNFVDPEGEFHQYLAPYLLRAARTLIIIWRLIVGGPMNPPKPPGVPPKGGNPPASAPPKPPTAPAKPPAEPPKLVVPPIDPSNSGDNEKSDNEKNKC